MREVRESFRLPAEQGAVPMVRIERGAALMTTDNRTNEPTEAMLDAAEKAYEDHWECGVRGDEFGERTCPFCGFLYQTQEDRKNRVQSAMDLMHARERHSLHAALVAAAGAAPQAEGEKRRKFFAEYGRGTAHPTMGAAPVLPSSGVDEAALADVINAALDKWEGDEPSEVFVARVIAGRRAEWLKEQGGESRAQDSA